jgi:hypothetical protein
LAIQWTVDRWGICLPLNIRNEKNISAESSMKQYLIDELRPDDYQRLKAYLDENFGASSVAGLYWIPLRSELLDTVQQAHTQCQPFYVAVELEPDRLACELLVRTTNRVRCDCIQYATEIQRNWIIQSIDAIFEKLNLKT